MRGPAGARFLTTFVIEPIGANRHWGLRFCTGGENSEYEGGRSICWKCLVENGGDVGIWHFLKSDGKPGRKDQYKEESHQ